MTQEQRWEDFIARLRAYIEEHHHCPNKHTALLNQTKYYRRKMKEGTLDADKATLLAALLATRDFSEHTGGRPKRSLCDAKR